MFPGYVLIASDKINEVFNLVAGIDGVIRFLKKITASSMKFV
jgi:transcription antitermination factor NusG